MNNHTNIDLVAEEQLDCPVYSSDSEQILDQFSFWAEGVLLCVIAVAGIIGNTISGIILSSKNMRNSFNLLLIALAIYDNTYLLGSILESCRKRFDLLSELHILLFPYFLYPIQMIAMTGSILMTVAIALERYVAVHYPINYNLAMNDMRALRFRLCRYLIPVVFLSVIMNVTKFLEIEVSYVEMVNEANVTYQKPVLNITEFRMNPIYSIYFNWFRFISIGVVPFALLAFFNFRIYLDLRRRRARKKLTHPPASTNIAATVIPSSCTNLNRASPPSRPMTPFRPSPNTNEDTTFTNLGPQHPPKGAVRESQALLHADYTDGRVALSLHKANSGPPLSRDGSLDTPSSCDGNQPANISKAVSFVKLSTSGRSLWKTKAVVVQNSVVAANDARRRVESNLAAIMMGYVMVFLVCHSPRLLLNIHELAIIRKAMACGRVGEKTFPLWSLVVMHISHLLLVVNSAINILIYCCLSSKFREEGRLMWEKCCRLGKRGRGLP